MKVEIVEHEQREPRIGGGTLPVSAVVQATHATSIDEALVRVAVSGLDRGTLEGLLTYCAEQRCIADDATCPGCRRRTEAAGQKTLDDFLAALGEVGAGGRLKVTGGGRGRLEVDSLEALAKSWAGEDYWFWARRVLRKLRHGLRRAHIEGQPVAGEGETPAVILMEPQLADNIGMVARAMANFGLDELRLIAPRDGWPNERARIAASGANYVIDDAASYSSLEAASGDLNWMCATTARQRDLRKPVLTPEQAVAELHARIRRGERCGMLFGRERNGLETSEVANADAVVMIPVNSRFASLNLAQAVLLLGYEWAKAGSVAQLGRVTTYESPIGTGLRLGEDRLANKEELYGLFEHLENELDRLGFFNPPHKRPAVVRNLRTMLTRMGPTEQEVRTLRGIVATLAQGKGKGRKSP